LLIADEVYREFMMETLSVMNIPGLEENAIMIDSVSKDTACGQELGVLFLKIKNYGYCNEICKRV
jgi:aspartate aminotransferase